MVNMTIICIREHARSVIYTSNLYVFPHKTSRNEALNKSPEWVCDFMAVQPSRMVQQHTWHNVWHSTLSAICLNYTSPCIVRKGIVRLRQARWICITTRRSCLGLTKYLYNCHCGPFITVSQWRDITKGMNGIIFVWWGMSLVSTCGCDIRQVLWWDAFFRQEFALSAGAM